ncbi:ATP-dependent 6-phosphofructokinase 6-like [Dorcoceras hygrometricum]|uniref:ATP-dependent 6-phosphofructokinase 6-like n=1 Tax=Dorcoceras hygrometricum TaxID=472368 RepID=A0A2Z7D4H6_9LAMI|nr:ATP-dependent 6-phosphofructokinase 6-like [Dorcoceras hygrometricum]
MKELLERSPTLPRTSKMVARKDGNSPEKFTVNSTRGFEMKNESWENKSLTFSEYDSLPNPFPALELDSLAGDEQDTAQNKGHQIEQSGNDDMVMTSYEHQAQETEPTSQTDEPRNKGNEHQAPAEPQSAPWIAQNLEDHYAITPPAKIVSDHQDPEYSNLQLVATVPQDSSTLYFLSTAAQSLDVLSTRVSSLDLSFARLRDDTNITRHHTTKLHDELKSTADGFDIKIDVMERTLTQRMVDELPVVKSQLAAIFEDPKDTGVAKNVEGGGSSSRPREGKNGGGPNGGRGGSSSQGGRGRNDDLVRVSSLDLSFARLRDDTNITRHHTTKLHDELKSTADGFDIKIDVMERTLTQRMVDELPVVKSQLAAIFEDPKDTGVAKNVEGGGSSSRPREGKNGGGPNGGRGGSSSQGGRGRNDDLGDPSNRFRYTPCF